MGQLPKVIEHEERSGHDQHDQGNAKEEEAEHGWGSYRHPSNRQPASYTPQTLMPLAQPTLLVFTLGPSREASRRRLLPSRLLAWERDLHQSGLDAALEAGRVVGCKLLVSSPEELVLPADATRLAQGSGSFGGRLAAAIELAAATGPLLVVGTDVPGLSADHLRRALRALESQPDSVALGPSPDGGLYLLAAVGLDPDTLTKVDWCRSSTRRDLGRILAAAGRSLLELEPLADLDRRADLERWLASSSPVAVDLARLRSRLRRILLALRRVRVAREAPAVSAASFVPDLGRAPPCCPA